MGSEHRLGQRSRCAQPSSSFPPGQAQQEVLENTATGRLQASGLPPSNATHSTTRSKLSLRLFLTEAQLMYNIMYVTSVQYSDSPFLKVIHSIYSYNKVLALLLTLYNTPL